MLSSPESKLSTKSVGVPVQNDANLSGLSRIRRLPLDAYFLAALVLWEFGALLAKAEAKPLWYDELVTFNVSGLQPFSRLWAALKAGVDGTPPFYYLIVQTARRLPGEPHQLIRLPSIFGYLLALLAIYLFVRKRRSGAIALVAVLLLSISPFREYAVEARPYGLLVGFLAIAAAVWQSIGEKGYRSLLLFLCLSVAVSCHYFAVVSLAIFGLAEAAFLLETRRIRWGVWLAVFGASLPFFVLFDHLVSFGRDFTPHFWSPAKWSDLIFTYADYVPFDLKIVLALLVLFLTMLGLYALERVRNGFTPHNDSDASRIAEMLLVAGFTLYPVLLVIITKMLKSVYYERYGWPAVFGLVLATIYFLRLPRFLSRLAVFALLVAFGFRGISDFARFHAIRTGEVDSRWSRLGSIVEREPDLPIVIGSGVRFLEAVEYATPRLRARFIELTDEATAVRLVGTDTVEKNNAALAKFVPLAVVQRSSFEAQHDRFLLYSTNQGFDWVTPDLLNRGYHLVLLGKVENDSVYLVTR